jgi:hypothetical protein
MVNYNQLFAIKAKNRRKILEVCPTAKEQSGIYIMTREENGFKYCYVGQAKNVLSRLADHLTGYQHIDLSIKSHKFYSADNPAGWKIGCLYFPEQLLDEKEQFYTMQYANAGYQMRNKTGGGQGKGKFGISENKPARGYYDGKKQGKKDLAKEIRDLVEKYLVISTKKDGVLSQKALKKFFDLIDETTFDEK